MGVLIEGVWRDQELPQETGRSGEFHRADSRFRGRIAADAQHSGRERSPILPGSGQGTRTGVNHRSPTSWLTAGRSRCA